MQIIFYFKITEVLCSSPVTEEEDGGQEGEEATTPHGELTNKLFGDEFTLRQARLIEELYLRATYSPYHSHLIVIYYNLPYISIYI